MPPNALNYATTVPDAKYRWWFWMIPAALGILQIPWFIFMDIHISDWHFLRNVAFTRDTILYALELTFTFAALATACLCIFYGWQNRHRLAVIVSAIVLLLSLFVLSGAAQEWYRNVYLASPGAIWLNGRLRVNGWQPLVAPPPPSTPPARGTSAPRDPLVFPGER